MQWLAWSAHNASLVAAVSFWCQLKVTYKALKGLGAKNTSDRPPLLVLRFNHMVPGARITHVSSAAASAFLGAAPALRNQLPGKVYALWALLRFRGGGAFKAAMFCSMFN